MTRFLLRRLAAAGVLLLLVLTLTFFLVHLAPGEPRMVLLDARVPAEQSERLARVLGLDRPLLEQYTRWLAAALTGEWGVSFTHQRPVREVLAAALPNTLVLAAAAMTVQYALGLLLGLVSAGRRPLSDHLLRVLALTLHSLPTFWAGMMAILLFSSVLPLFPPEGMQSADAVLASPAARLADRLHHLALPALVLGLTAAGGTSRFVRNSLREVMGQDYVRTPRALGIGERRVLGRHVLPNALAPVVQLVGLSFPRLLSGSLVLEIVFSWPGMGRLAYDAIYTQNHPLLLATTAIAGAMVVTGSLLADLLHAAVDPRVREAL